MPITGGHDTAKTRKTLTVGGQSVADYSIPAATEAGLGDFSNLPAALKVVLENMLRFEDDKTVTVDELDTHTVSAGATVGYSATVRCIIASLGSLSEVTNFDRVA